MTGVLFPVPTHVPTTIGSRVFITHIIVMAIAMPAVFGLNTPNTTIDRLPLTATSATGTDGTTPSSR